MCIKKKESFQIIMNSVINDDNNVAALFVNQYEASSLSTVVPPL